MAPTEATILRNYLLLPSRLPSIISLQEFTSLFPKSQQSSPQVRALYRDLQQQRNAVVDTVSANIDAEVKQAKALRRTIIRTQKESEYEEQDDEIEIERAVGSNPPFKCLWVRKLTTMPPVIRVYIHHDCAQAILSSEYNTRSRQRGS